LQVLNQFKLLSDQFDKAAHVAHRTGIDGGEDMQDLQHMHNSYEHALEVLNSLGCTMTGKELEKKDLMKLLD